MSRVSCSRNVGRRFIQYSVLEKDRSFAVGDELHGYTVERIVPVSELSLTAIHLQHRSGAQHLHISRQDSNNVFGSVIFKDSKIYLNFFCDNLLLFSWCCFCDGMAESASEVHFQWEFMNAC